MTPELLVLDPAAFGPLAARRVAAELRAVLRTQARCSLGLSGGSTPRPIYQQLAAEHPDGELWSRVDLYFADERCVPPGDPASNYRMVKEWLLDLVPLDPDRVHRMAGERADQDEAARDYERVLPERLDLLLLGLGADGHTASLFPEASSLAESRRRVLAVPAPKPPHDRLTVTPPVIRGAGLTIGLVSGADKSAAVARVIDGPFDPLRTPGQLARNGLWIVDTAAAAQLEARR